MFKPTGTHESEQDADPVETFGVGSGHEEGVYLVVLVLNGKHFSVDPDEARQIAVQLFQSAGAVDSMRGLPRWQP